MQTQTAGDRLGGLTVVGLNHATAPVELLEQVTVGEAEAADLLTTAIRDARGAMLLATCGRLELYVEQHQDGPIPDDLFHLLGDRAGLTIDELHKYLYVHRATDAVRHLFSVATGLDSVVIGEDQILGQIKDSLERAQRLGTAGQKLNQLAQAALRTGKRARSETGLNKAGRDLATVGIAEFEEQVGPLAGRHALVVGAGSMGAVMAAALRRAGVARFDVANRTVERAQRLADTAGGRGASLAEIPDLLTDVDVVLTCIGGAGTIITTELVKKALRQRGDRRLFVLDLALPRNVEAGVADLPGVTLVDLQRLSDSRHDGDSAASVDAAWRIVEAETEAFRKAQLQAQVGSVLAAMRSTASAALEAELDRLNRRIPELAEREQREIANSLRRVVDKLLHRPTVRARRLAATPEGAVYLDVLGDLFNTPNITDRNSEALV